MALGSLILEILQRPTIGGVLCDLAILVAPLWIAVIVGVLVGWAWKPHWANLGRDVSVSSSNSSSFSLKASSSLLPSFKFRFPSWFSSFSDNAPVSLTSSSTSLISSASSSKLEDEKLNFVNEHDLEHLYKLVEVKDEGPVWIQMMDRSTSNMSYQAWRRDPETGPPQYRSRTVFEDATPEMVRDFFWDDEFRSKWDDMLVHASVVQECLTTGTMLVRWVRKFPFFCSDREYIIGRRIWDAGRVYYCVTKDVPCPFVPKRGKPRRVDSYYSSWCIRAVESKKGDGQMTACEVLLFHHEEMGIPWEIAKLGVRQGMWGTVKKIEPGLRAFQKQRATGAPLTHCSRMAHINTKISTEYLRSLETSSKDPSEIDALDSDEKPGGRNIPRFLVVGGAIALACTLDRGLLTKAIIFGVARRFAKMGRRM